MIAKLFAMILDHRIAVWAEDEGIKANCRGALVGFKPKQNSSIRGPLLLFQEAPIGHQR